MSLTKVTYSMISGAPVYVADYGAIGNGTTDDTAAIQAALTAAAGQTLVLAANAIYKCTSSLTVSGSIQGNNATFKFYGTTPGNATGSLLYTNVEGNLLDFIIDGTNMTSVQCGLWVNTDYLPTRTSFYRLSINNILNSNNTQAANGMVVINASTATYKQPRLDIQVNVDVVTATANGTIGDNAGAAAGIAISMNSTGSNATINIHDCIVKSITPAEDAIGIYILTADHTSESAKGLFTVQNCKIYDSAKYGVKLQAANVLVQHTIVENTTLTAEENFTSYGYNVVFQDCLSLLTQAYGFALHGKKSTIDNCRVKGASLNPQIGIFTNADNSTVSNCIFETTATFSSNDSPIIRYQGAAKTIFTNIKLINAANTGTMVEVTGSSVDAIFSNIAGTGFYYGFQFAYSAGTARITNSNLNASYACVYGLGTAGQTVYVNDCLLTAANGLLLTTSSSIVGAFIDNCEINATGVGASLAVASSIRNSSVVSQSAAAGTGVSGQNIIVRDCKIFNFLVGIDYSFSTTAEIANNVTVGSGTSIVATGVTPFATYSNYSR